MASPSRIELVDLLVQGERSVEELSEASRLSVANASQHLQHLRRAGVVTRRRNGRQILYNLADERVLELMAILRGMTEANHAAAQHTADECYHARDSLAPVTRDELTERLRRRSVRLIDVRPEIEYRAAHIPGALGIPVIALPQHLNALPKRPEVVAYCRGPYCVMAYKAIEILRPVGYRARRRWRVHGVAQSGSAASPPRRPPAGNVTAEPWSAAVTQASKTGEKGHRSMNTGLAWQLTNGNTAAAIISARSPLQQTTSPLAIEGTSKHRDTLRPSVGALQGYWHRR